MRHEVLRPSLPLESAMYPEDDNPEVLHLAARDDASAVIGCVTFFPEPFEGAQRSWRFRGMATVERYRNRGIGGNSSRQASPSSASVAANVCGATVAAPLAPSTAATAS